MTKTETKEFWSDPENQCLFFEEVDKWLRKNNRYFESDDKIVRMYGEFLIFNAKGTVILDDPIEHIRYWMENANPIIPRLGGYSSKMWENSSLIEHCKEYNFIGDSAEV